MAAKQYIYLVNTPDGTPRLVRASIRQQALSHVAQTMLSVQLASQEELVELVNSGVKVENFKDKNQLELNLTKEQA